MPERPFCMITHRIDNAFFDFHRDKYNFRCIFFK